MPARLAAALRSSVPSSGMSATTTPAMRGERRAGVLLEGDGVLGRRQRKRELRLADGSLEADPVLFLALPVQDRPVVDPDLAPCSVVPGNPGDVPVDALLAAGGVCRPIKQRHVRPVDRP